jgi:uncharacterized membrane protein YbhN (UPF0104 family)
VNGKLGLLLRLACVALVVVGVVYFARSVDTDKLGASLARASLWPIALAAVLNFGCQWGKAVCWRVMLAPRFVVPTRQLMRYTIVTAAASALAPARAGEVLRAWLLRRRHGVTIAEVAAVSLAEKLLDAIAMLLLAAPVPWLLPTLPGWVGRSIAITAGIAIAAFAVLYALIGRVQGASWFARFLDGLHVIRAPRRLALAIGAMIVVWLIDLAMVLLVLHAVGVELPIAGGILILFTLNLAIVVPSTPGQVGALELGALVATDLLGVPREPAIAFALLYHFLQVIPIVIAGLALELRLVIGRERPETAAAAAA